jgi:hypothetical protein
MRDMTIDVVRHCSREMLGLRANRLELWVIFMPQRQSLRCSYCIRNASADFVGKCTE